MDRLKKQGELELKFLPERLSIEDRIAQLREQRAEGREVGRETRAEGREVGREGREEARGERTDTRRFGQQRELLGEQTEQGIKKDIGIRRGRMDILKEFPNDPLAREIATGHSPVRSSVRQFAPPTTPGYEGMIERQKDSGDLLKLRFPGMDPKRIEKDLEFGDPVGNYIPWRRKSMTAPPAPQPTTTGPSGKADNKVVPTARPASQIPFDAVPKAPSFTKPDVPGITPPTPAEPGKGDKLSGLLDALKQNGYTDDEARQVLARVVKPTSDPDVFDVLVG
jgi:hypothetical protein